MKIGVLTDMTGYYSDLSGPGSLEAAKMAAEDFGGKVLGKPIVIIGADHQLKADVASTVARKWFDEEKVDAIIGPSGSPNAMGVIQFAAEAGVPMFAPVGTAAVVLPMDDKKKWVFKTPHTDRMACERIFLDLKGRMTMGEGDELLKDKVNSLILQGRKKLVLNLADVPYVDSAGLGEIVRTYTTVSRQGGSLKLLNLTKRIEDLLSITKLLTVFDTFDSEAEAIKSFTK